MRIHRVRTLVVIIAILLGVLHVSGCSDDDSKSSQKILSRGLNGDPESLDPHKFSSIQAGDVLRDIGEGLIVVSPTGGIAPGVAESWTVSDDGRTYTFKIRQDARWSNGEHLIAEDFVISLRRAFDPTTASRNAGRLDDIKNAKQILSGHLKPDELGVRASDKRTLEIQLEAASPYFLSLLTHPSAYPIHRSALQLSSDEKAFRPESYVSNGAYVLVDREPGSNIVLQKNQYYWDAPNVFFDVVQYHVVEPAREVVRYLSGELDVTSNVDGDYFLQLSRSNASELRVSPKLGVYYYGFNLAKEPFRSSINLRAALSLAIDRQVIVDAVTQRGELPAYNFVPPGVENYEQATPVYSRVSQGEREALARDLYEKAGFSRDNPITIELRYNTGGGHEKIALAVSAMWSETLGARVNLVKEEFGVFIENVMSKKETEVYRLSWTADYNDAQSFLQLFQSNNSNNLTSYSNSEVDELLRLSAHELDQERRLTLMLKAEELALSEFPVIPVYFFVSKHLVAPHICGWQSNILDYHFSKNLQVCGN